MTTRFFLLDSYDEGRKAAWEGEDVFANPHTNPNSPELAFTSWQAGWIYGKRNGATEESAH